MDMSSTFKGVFGTILNVWTAKESDALLGTRVVMWVLHFNPAQLQFCCKFPKLARFILKARAGQLACCLSSFFRLPCFFRLSRKWRKHSFKDNGISDADILSFRDRLEIDLKQKNMWEQLKSGKSHTILCTWNKRVSDIVFHHWMAGIPG